MSHVIGLTIWLNKSAEGLYFLPAQFTMQAMGKARESKKKGLPSELERSPVVSAVLNEVRTFFKREEGKNS